MSRSIALPSAHGPVPRDLASFFHFPVAYKPAVQNIHRFFERFNPTGQTHGWIVHNLFLIQNIPRLSKCPVQNFHTVLGSTNAFSRFPAFGLTSELSAYLFPVSVLPPTEREGGTSQGQRPALFQNRCNRSDQFRFRHPHAFTDLFAVPGIGKAMKMVNIRAFLRFSRAGEGSCRSLHRIPFL